MLSALSKKARSVSHFNLAVCCLILKTVTVTRDQVQCQDPGNQAGRDHGLPVTTEVSEVHTANNKTTFSHTQEFHSWSVVGRKSPCTLLASLTLLMFAKTRPGIISLSMSEEMKVGP